MNGRFLLLALKLAFLTVLNLHRIIQHTNLPENKKLNISMYEN